MNRIALDLKQFKHIKSDNHSHTLQHKDGHVLTIATKALHPDNQKQLEALATAASKKTDKSEGKQDKVNLAKGGKTSNYSIKTETNPVADEDETGKPEGTYHTITATDKHGDEAGRYEFFHHLNHPTKGEHISVLNANTYGKHKRKGLATTAYNEIEKITKAKVLPREGDQTKEAKAFWANRNKKKMADGGQAEQPEQSPDIAQEHPIANTFNQVMEQSAGKNTPEADAIINRAQQTGQRPSNEDLQTMLTPSQEQTDKAANAVAGTFAPAEGVGTLFGKPIQAVREYMIGLGHAPQAVEDMIRAMSQQKFGKVSLQEASHVPSDLRGMNMQAAIKQGKPLTGHAKGGEVQGYAEGGEAEETVEQPAEEQPLSTMQHIQQGGQEAINKFVAPSEEEQYLQNKQAEEQAKHQSVLSSLPGREAHTPSEAGQPSPISSETDQLPLKGVAESLTPKQTPISNVAKADLSNPMALGEASLTNQQNAATTQFGAQKQLATDQAEALKANEAARNTAIAQTKQAVDENIQERKNLMEDYHNGHVDPEQYWTGDKNGNGSHSRIMAGIGMLLAGFNPTAKPNAAIEYLQHQMDQNIEAQKANLNAKHNLIQANLQAFHNIKDATDMTRLQQNDYVESQLKNAMNKAATPMALASMQNAVGELQKNSVQLSMQLSLRQALGNILNGKGPQAPGALGHQIDIMEAMGSPEAKNLRERYVPAVDALAGRTVTAQDMNTMTAHRDVNDLLNSSLQFAKNHGTWDKLTDMKARSDAETLHGQLIGAIKQAQHDGVYKPSEADFLTAQVGPSASSMLANWTSVPKIQRMQSIMQKAYKNHSDSLGLPYKPLPQLQNEQQFQMKNGVKYQKVPGGWVPAQ